MLRSNKLDYRFVFFSSLEALFWAMMAPSAYTVVFMQDQGFNNSQIGLGLAAINLASFMFLPVWGMVADKIGSRRKTLLILYTGIAIFGTLTSILTGNVALTILLMFSVIIFRGSVSAITDSWLITEVNTPDLSGSRINYGPVRSAGSIGYALATLIFYFLFTRLNVSTRFNWLISASLAVACFILVSTYKETQSDRKAVPVSRKLSLKELKPGRLLKNYYFVTFFFIYMLINIPGYIGTSYIPQLLKDMGMNAVFVGVLGAIRALCEVPLLFLSTKIIKELGYVKTLFIIGTVLGIEQLSYILADHLIEVIIFQIVHGSINGLLLGAAAGYLFSLVPPELVSTSQTFCSASCSAISIVGSLISGPLIDTFGVRSIYVVTVSSMVIAIVMFALTLYIGKVRKIEHYDASKDEVSKEIMQKLYS